jgi:hypothetical protein
MSKPVSIATFLSNKEQFEQLQKFLNDNGCENEHPWIEPENLPLNDQEAVASLLITNSSSLQMPSILIIDEEILPNLTGVDLRMRLLELVPKLGKNIPTIFLSEKSSGPLSDIVRCVQWRQKKVFNAPVKSALKEAIEDLIFF